MGSRFVPNCQLRVTAPRTFKSASGPWKHLSVPAAPVQTSLVWMHFAAFESKCAGSYPPVPQVLREPAVPPKGFPGSCPCCHPAIAFIQTYHFSALSRLAVSPWLLSSRDL